MLDIGGTATHEALHGIDGAFGLREQAAARWFADNDGAIGIEADDGGAKRAAIRTRDALRLVRLWVQVCDEAVGGAEIDSYDFAHDENREGLNPSPTKAPFGRW